MSVILKISIITILSFIAVIISVGNGSVNIPTNDIFNIIGHQLFNHPLSEDIALTTVTILWNIRIPRMLMAFIVGAALSISGAVMQSVLRNPLASSYTLGVSSGASLGASIVIVFGLQLPFIGVFTLPLVGFLAGFATVMFIMALSVRLDKSMSNHTIILVGMVFSLFMNALLTLITAFSRQYLEQLVFWQMGSLSGRSWNDIGIVLMISIVGILALMRYSRELDIMTFGEERALSMGVDLNKVKFRLIGICSLLTGSVISFVGIIGFVDLIVPHLTRKLFGSSHQLILPLTAFIGGGFMVLADLISRTILSPSELPIGAVTALIGAPFFASVFFKNRKRGDKS